MPSVHGHTGSGSCRWRSAGRLWGTKNWAPNGVTGGQAAQRVPGGGTVVEGVEVGSVERVRVGRHHPRHRRGLGRPGPFTTLNRRYGPWGLALLEALVRLADMACSEEDH